MEEEKPEEPMEIEKPEEKMEAEKLVGSKPQKIEKIWNEDFI